MRTYLLGGTVYTPDEVVEHGAVVVEGGKIRQVCPASSLAPGEGQQIDLTGLKVTPGLIDLHLHGLEGADVMAGGAAEVAEKAVRSGVTSFLATTLTASLDEIKAVIRGVVRHRGGGGAELLGIHLEGPYLSPRYAGMMDVSYFRPFAWAEMQELLEVGEGLIKMVTLAPEIEGATAGIGQLEAAGVVTSVGHSDASFSEMKAAFDAGLRHATHAFNAMRGFHHREPGTVGAVLAEPAVVAQFIADGQHLHPASIELLLRTKGVESLALISDATPLAGLPPGEYEWRGAVLEVSEGKAQVKFLRPNDQQQAAESERAGSPSRPPVLIAPPSPATGAGDTSTGRPIGGSVRMMNYGLRLLVERSRLPLSDALKTAAGTPARVLGLAERKGRLMPGWDADIAVFDERFECRLAMVGGRIVYRATRT